jgi:hypothetical protein
MASTQTITVLDASELTDGQMYVKQLTFRLRSSQSYRKEVEFGKDGKVLLSRIGDKIHATSAFCELVA